MFNFVSQLFQISVASLSGKYTETFSVKQHRSCVYSAPQNLISFPPSALTHAPVGINLINISHLATRPTLQPERPAFHYAAHAQKNQCTRRLWIGQYWWAHMWPCCPEHPLTPVFSSSPQYTWRRAAAQSGVQVVCGVNLSSGAENHLRLKLRSQHTLDFQQAVFLLHNRQKNHVAETMTPEQHRKLEHPDVFLQGSPPSGLFYRPAMNTHRFDLISPYDHPFHLSFIADCLAELSANPFKVTQHKFGAVCELCFLSRSDWGFQV